MKEARWTIPADFAPRHSEAAQAPLPPHLSSSCSQQSKSLAITLRQHLHKMDDIHAPTVSSGPTSSGYSNGIPKEQLTLQELIAEKDRVETELKALGQVLDSVRRSRL
jgi:hypothetical protein